MWFITSVIIKLKNRCKVMKKILYNSITPPSSITTFTFINTNKRIIRGFNSAKDQAMSKKGLEDMGFCHFDLFRYVCKWFVSPLSLPPYFRRMEAFLKLALPIGWQSLSDSHLLYFFRRFSRNLPMEEILTLCLFKWADLRVLCCTPPQKKMAHTSSCAAMLPSNRPSFRPPNSDRHLRHWLPPLFPDYVRPHHSHRQSTRYRQRLLGSAARSTL